MSTERLLLDTHVFLWWRGNPQRIGRPIRERIANAAEVYVSSASAWEVAIKLALGRLRIPESFEKGVDGSGFKKLSITFVHAEYAGGLPAHHKDPFDRMLVAQAQTEDLILVSGDSSIHAYDANFLKL